MPFQHRFWSVLAPFWRAKMTPKSIKNRSKLSFRAFLFPYRFLHRFFIDFCSQLGLPGFQKTLFFLYAKRGFFKKTPSEDNIDFGLDFGANLPPCWPPKSKIFWNYGIPRSLQNFINFWPSFFCDFGASWLRFGSPRWLQNRSKIDLFFSVSASLFILIFDRFLLPTSTHWISKKCVFL